MRFVKPTMLSIVALMGIALVAPCWAGSSASAEFGTAEVIGAPPSTIASPNAAARPQTPMPSADTGTQEKSTTASLAPEIISSEGTLLQDLAIALVLLMGIAGLLWVRRHAAQL